MEDFTLDYFINYYEAIPEDQWCITYLVDDYGRRCAFGHLGMEFWQPPSILPPPRVSALLRLTKPLGYEIAIINNGDDDRFQQPTPKERTLAALMEIKAMQQPPALQPIFESKKHELCTT